MEDTNLVLRSVRCHLLRLPRELRDQIYASAFSHEPGLYFHRTEPYKAAFSTSDTELIEANQLQYTCRQLRAETLGVEWGYNDLIFQERCDVPQKGENVYLERFPAVQFTGFMDMCDEKWRQRMRRVHLHIKGLSMPTENDLLSARDLHTVVSICESYPQMTILWHNNLVMPFFLPLLDVLGSCLMLARAVRVSSPADKYANELQVRVPWSQARLLHSYWHVRSKDERQRDGMCLMGKQCRTRIMAENFRIVPFDKLAYDEGLTRKRLREEMSMDDKGAEGKMALYEKRVLVVREWFDNGL
jgi:hypothetical protein